MTSSRQFALETLEARLGYKMAAHLARSAESLPHDVQERLKAARHQALARRKKAAAPAAAPSAAPAVVGMSASGAATLGSGGDLPGWLQSLLYAVPAVVLVIGFWGVHATVQERQQAQLIAQVADIDAEMLADELPPVAYLESGFSTFAKDENP
jgi:hypothetical protein